MTTNASAPGCSPAREAVRELAGRHPRLRFCALGARENAGALDLDPFGIRAEFLDAAERGAHPDWVGRYLEANQRAFGGPLALPGWVLVDCYLMPGAIGLLVGPAAEGERIEADTSAAPRERVEDAEGERVVAAYVALPSVEPGVFVGCSLFSFEPGGGVARLVKALTLKMLRARVQRGIAQWHNGSLRVHTRMGPLRLEGPVPKAHGQAADSFAYRVELGDEARWGRALRGEPDGAGAPGVWVPVDDRARLGRLLGRAREGEIVEVCAPGLDAEGRRVLVRAADGAP
ncbi:MAG: hypothetical protein MUF34_04360 [Polyangiaceae bacterium]|nr:hypothetical protein [Polyangiaceae bacterium]